MRVSLPSDEIPYLLEDENRWLLSCIDADMARNKESGVWDQVIPAPMYIHATSMGSLKLLLEGMFPEYCIAYDYVFESKRGVPYHCDFNTIGPFETSFSKHAPQAAFISVHYSLSNDESEFLVCD